MDWVKKFFTFVIIKKFLNDKKNEKFNNNEDPKNRSLFDKLHINELFFYAVKNLLEEIRIQDPVFFKESIPDEMKIRYRYSYASFVQDDNTRYKTTKMMEDGFKIKFILDNPANKKGQFEEPVQKMIQVFQNNILI